jgi:Anti-sigma factor NepR
MTKRGDPGLPAPKEPAPEGSAAQETAPAKMFPIHEHIGRQLRNMFEDVVAQPVPERLCELLDELERKRSGK